MSFLYWIIISQIGRFSIGRFVDLFQQDLVVALLTGILILEWRRWVKVRDR